MPRSRSTLTRSERIEQAHEYMSKGWRNADIARKLRIHPDTVASYRSMYEAEIAGAKRDHPEFLQDVLGNTFRALAENNEVIRDAWKQVHRRGHACDECGCDTYLSDTSRQGYLNVILKAQDSRNKLFGLLGVRQDYFTHVQQIQALQVRLLEFLQEQLCDGCRGKLLEFLSGPEMASHVTPELMPMPDEEEAQIAV